MTPAEVWYRWNLISDMRDIETHGEEQIEQWIENEVWGEGAPLQSNSNALIQWLLEQHSEIVLFQIFNSNLDDLAWWFSVIRTQCSGQGLTQGAHSLSCPKPPTGKVTRSRCWQLNVILLLTPDCCRLAGQAGWAGCLYPRSRTAWPSGVWRIMRPWR